MPTYDYVCDNCDHDFELFQQMTASVKKKCPECGENKLRRLVGSGAGIIFKGTGFYETDYRSKSYRKAAEAEKNGATGSGKDKKKDGKKASKADGKKESAGKSTESKPPKPK